MDVRIRARSIRALAAGSVVAVLLAGLVWVPTAAAKSEFAGELVPGTEETKLSQPGSTDPQSQDQPELASESLRLTSQQAIRLARRDPNVIAAQADRGNLQAVTQAKPPDTWQVGFRDGADEVVQVLVDDPTGTVRESWTGHQVEWQMARGYEGSFGHKLNAPYIWIPLCLLFVLALLDWRRPWRFVHLDLLVLLAFGISHIYFNRGEIGVSVPLVYPVLVYLLGRALWIGFRGVGRGLTPSTPVSWLAICAIFLIAFRAALNIADSGVIDVGYAGVIGADRITHLDPIWGMRVFPDDNPFGDTYGPVNYIAYVPFELGLPWSGEWDELASAHGAALAFDLATVAGLFFLGRRLREGEAGTELGTVLAFAWLAYPYTAYTLQSNANDTLLAAFLVWSLVLFARPLARGALLAAATLAKFAPLVLVPLYATGERGLASLVSSRRAASSEASAGAGLDRRWLTGAGVFVFAFLFACAAFLALPAVDSGLATFYERTISSQIDRTSPFSVWGQTDLEWLQTTIRAGAVALALLVAFVPRRRTLPQIAALTAAVLIAVQLTADHWFYLYIVWFFGPLIVAIAVGGTRTSRPA